MIQARALHALYKIINAEQIAVDRASLIAYEVDAGLDKGLPNGIVFPRTPEEVVRILQWSHEYQIPLVARGAGTGLSGGSVADRGGIIVEFAHMNRLRELDIPGRRAVVEPALINLHLAEQVKAAGLYFPPDPSSQRVSTMGGNVAENSGGPHCFKYGVTTNYVLGMQVALASGRLLQLGGLALDYPEYDLCGLLTGSEGLLGLITSIVVRLVRNPPGVKTLLAVFESIEQAGEAVSAVIASGLVPATMEMMDQRIVGIIEPFARANLPLDAGAVLIVEVDGYPASLTAQMDELIQILERHGGRQMRIARDEEERYKIWLARKSAAGAIAREAPAYCTVDITVPRSRLAEMLVEVNRICDLYQVRAGHVFHAGDGNLHPLVLIPDPEDPELIQRVHLAGRDMVNYCVKMGGSLTGEHGVGIEKREFMPLMHTATELMAMWKVKQAFDPDCLLNPGKVFPSPLPDEPGPYAGYLAESQIVHQSQYPLPVSETFNPSHALEAADWLHTLSQQKRAVLISNQAQRAEGARMSSEGLRDIVCYAPEDMYITVGAGARLSEIQSFLAQYGKQIALASPWPMATIGGLVAANVNAPLRMRYGAVRDQVLCATVALTDGNVIRTGRPIVKNVAGFDMTKLFVGSYGTLGLLTDLSLRIHPLPRTIQTLLIPVDRLEQGLVWGQQLAEITLNASALVLCSEGQDQARMVGNNLLIYTVEGLTEDVSAELQQVRNLLKQLGAPTPLEATRVSGTAIWTETLGNQLENSLLVRIGLPTSILHNYFLQHAHVLVPGKVVLDIANGFLYIRRVCASCEEAQEWLAALRGPALADSGYAVVMDLPLEWEGQIERWGYQAQSLPLMQRLKDQFDPQSILNPLVLF
ncbi:FAD-binding oxidoreductase [Tengunoibacter tsumagoiensis]|uniref:Lactate dehydrogenase n=1 Tax=Tengunoibacter tsumagoiensis TaxID=2014871 RepID=A0A401ZUQ3_9CHLR|nr:FAD-binding oxidoreductase [Tengunoibacter tsumagoiensis]GCE10454.1 lactate dehydrogenase [Tengunoibacter tsumagoiensis]